MMQGCVFDSLTAKACLSKDACACGRRLAGAQSFSRLLASQSAQDFSKIAMRTESSQPIAAREATEATLP